LLVATPFGCTRLKVHRGDLQAGGADAGGPKAIKSSMPGKVVRILVEKGQKVEKGQPLLILEAMKMENEIRSHAAGVVQDIAVAVGAKVEAGALLIKIGAE
jgi:biotin carboxyl carrier protein